MGKLHDRVEIRPAHTAPRFVGHLELRIEARPSGTEFSADQKTPRTDGETLAKVILNSELFGLGERAFQRPVEKMASVQPVVLPTSKAAGTRFVCRSLRRLPPMLLGPINYLIQGF